MIKFILLGFLNYQPMTGYELKQTIDESTAHFWHAYHSQIYTTLRQMEGDELVTSRLVREEGRPDQRVYTITPAGQHALQAWLEQTMTEVSPIKEELLVRLFFSAGRDPQQVLTELRLQRELHQEKLSAYQSIAGQIITHAAKEHHVLERDGEFWRLTLELGIRYEEAYVGWLQDAIRKIEAF
jgi:PadR family transcriptional regulator, phenolic acid-responsive transcriptional regulator